MLRALRARRWSAGDLGAVPGRDGRRSSVTLFARRLRPHGDPLRRVAEIDGYRLLLRRFEQWRRRVRAPVVVVETVEKGVERILIVERVALLIEERVQCVIGLAGVGRLPCRMILVEYRDIDGVRYGEMVASPQTTPLDHCLDDSQQRLAYAR